MPKKAGKAVGASLKVSTISNNSSALSSELNQLLEKITNNSITKIRIADIGDAEAIAIAEALKVNQSVTTADLSRNNIGDAGATAIAEALKANQYITTVDLSYNNIGYAGAIAIAEVLKMNHPIVKMSLNYNKIKSEGATAIAHALNGNDFIIDFKVQVWSTIHRPFQGYSSIEPWGDIDQYQDIKVESLLRNKSIFSANLDRFKALNSTKANSSEGSKSASLNKPLVNEKQELESMGQFLATLSYKALYIFGKQVLSLDNKQEAKEYNQLIKRGFADKLFHEIKLDDYLPNIILQNIVFPYLNENDIHDIAFIGQARDIIEVL